MSVSQTLVSLPALDRAPMIPAVAGKCSLCSSLLAGDCTEAGLRLGICATCEVTRPEAKGFKVARMVPAKPAPAAAAIRERGPAVARAPRRSHLKGYEWAMIKTLGSQLPVGRLLALLNERRREALGPKAPVVGLEQLRDSAALISVPLFEDDAGLRERLQTAKESGSLAHVTQHVIDAFATVYNLAPGQVRRLEAILLPAAADGSAE